MGILRQKQRAEARAVWQTAEALGIDTGGMSTTSLEKAIVAKGGGKKLAAARGTEAKTVAGGRSVVDGAVIPAEGAGEGATPDPDQPKALKDHLKRELIEIAERLGVPTTGNKADIIERIESKKPADAE